MNAPDPYASCPWADPDPDSRARRMADAAAAAAWRQTANDAGNEEVRLLRLAEQAAAEDEQTWDDGLQGWDDDPPHPTVLARTDGACGGYEGQAGVIGGASEGGKTRFADMGTIQEFELDRPVIRWDLENGLQLSRQGLKDMGMTRAWARDLWRYKAASGLWTPAKASKEAERFRTEGGRLVVMDSGTAIAQALGLEVSGGKAEDVQTLYARALHPWRDAGCCAVVIDNTNKAGPLDLAGSQYKKAGLDFGLGVVLRTPHGIGQHGAADVYVLKDRGAGIRWVSRQITTDADGVGTGEVFRYFGRLTSTPNPHRQGVHSRGVDFALMPPDETTGPRTKEEAKARIADARARQNREDADKLLTLLPFDVDGADGMNDSTIRIQMDAKYQIKLANGPRLGVLVHLLDGRVVSRPGRGTETLRWRSLNPVGPGGGHSA